MVTPEAEPSKSMLPAESKAWARKERWVPAGMLPMIPPHTPLLAVRSTVMEGISAALEVTETREMSEWRAWLMETMNWAEPVLEEESEQAASSAKPSASR